MIKDLIILFDLITLGSALPQLPLHPGIKNVRPASVAPQGYFYPSVKA